jgi:hypothetical protein
MDIVRKNPGSSRKMGAQVVGGDLRRVDVRRIETCCDLVSLLPLSKINIQICLTDKHSRNEVCLRLKSLSRLKKVGADFHG